MELTTNEYSNTYNIYSGGEWGYKHTHHKT